MRIYLLGVQRSYQLITDELYLEVKQTI